MAARWHTIANDGNSTLDAVSKLPFFFNDSTATRRLKVKECGDSSSGESTTGYSIARGQVRLPSRNMLVFRGLEFVGCGASSRNLKAKGT